MISKLNKIEYYFRVLSYCVILCGFVSLWVSGTFGVISSIIFVLLFTLAILLEDSRWQVSERLGTVLVVLAMPTFFLAWKIKLFGFTTSETLIAGILARLILSLTVIKLFQKKTDRDWIFLYLMAFFEVLLAAGLSISALYFGSFLVYLVVTVCVIILFEIRKTSTTINKKNNTISLKSISKPNLLEKLPLKKIPLIGFVLIFLIISFAGPMYFLLPRVGGAGFGGNQVGVSNTTGFSDSVSLGEIGKIQQNDRIAMRVRLEGKYDSSNLRWRGVALDNFDNKTWSKSIKNSREKFSANDKDIIQIDYAESRDEIAIQTVYLEPMDTPTIFALSRPVTVQGNFNTLTKDSEGGIQFLRGNFERVSYKVYSDTKLPDVEDLQRDSSIYTKQSDRYLQLPSDMDKRVSELSFQVTQNSNNRYDKAKLIENYLQTQFGYTLEQKSSGDQPVVNFLFNVREGHCEYFATAMAVMLRTQGIATRIVNGFQTGEYNETAGVYVVKHRNAHSWVEVYFPKENVWVPFDPTPFAGQTVGNTSAGGLAGIFNKYIEALETFWIQYFIAYDNQEQQSLMRSMRSGFVDFQAKGSDWINQKQSEITDWWKDFRGDKGIQGSLVAAGYAIRNIFVLLLGTLLLIWFYRKIKRQRILEKLSVWFRSKKQITIIEFYERMQNLLKSKGLIRESHQTPLEFALTVNMPEVVSITEKYNKVRFSAKPLSKNESEEIEHWLNELEEKEFKK